MVNWWVDGAVLPLRVASEMGEKGVFAVSSRFAVTFHIERSTAAASSSTNAPRASDNITFPASAQARGTVGRGAGSGARRAQRLAIMAVGDENSRFMTAKMRDYRAFE